MDTAREQRILKFSIGVTIAVSAVGFIGGLLVGVAHLVNLRLNHGHVHDASCAH